MQDSVRVPIIVRVPPPLLYVATFFAGIFLQRFVALPIHSTPVVATFHDIGIVLASLGVVLALSCVAMFLFFRTTLAPFGAASSLVTRGAYRFTRNPMYLSLTLVYLGAVGTLGQFWSLALLPIPVAILNALVIPFEEARMREIFAEEYSAYCARVRRWL